MKYKNMIKSAFVCTSVSILGGITLVNLHAQEIRQNEIRHVGTHTLVLNEDARNVVKPLPNNIAYGRQQLNDEEKKAYDLIINKVLNYNNDKNDLPRTKDNKVLLNIDFRANGIKLTKEELYWTFKAAFGDDPRLFVLANEFFRSSDNVIHGGEDKIGTYPEHGQEYVASYDATFRYFQNGHEYLDALLEMEKSVTSILSNVKEGMSEYQIHETIRNAFEHSVHYSLNEAFDAGIGYAMLGGTHSGACGGYAWAFEYLLKRAGIESIVIGGYANKNDKEHSGHAWNNVKLDGKWYLSDATWNWGPRSATNDEVMLRERFAGDGSYQVIEKIEDNTPSNWGNVELNEFKEDWKSAYSSALKLFDAYKNKLNEQYRQKIEQYLYTEKNNPEYKLYSHIQIVDLANEIYKLIPENQRTEYSSVSKFDELKDKFNSYCSTNLANEIKTFITDYTGTDETQIVNEQSRQLQVQRDIEQQRLANEQRQAEAQRLANEQRQAEAQRLANEQRQAEQQRIANEQRQAEQQRLVNEKRQGSSNGLSGDVKAQLDKTTRLAYQIFTYMINHGNVGNDQNTAYSLQQRYFVSVDSGNVDQKLSEELFRFVNTHKNDIPYSVMAFYNTFKTEYDKYESMLNANQHVVTQQVNYNNNYQNHQVVQNHEVSRQHTSLTFTFGYQLLTFMSDSLNLGDVTNQALSLKREYISAMLSSNVNALNAAKEKIIAFVNEHKREVPSFLSMNVAIFNDEFNK